MNIIKDIQQSNGSILSLHRVQMIRANRTVKDLRSLTATVASWTNSEAFTTEQKPSAMEAYNVVISTTNGIDVFLQASEYLINDESSPFFGGIIENTPVGTDSLAAAKILKWIEIKNARSATEFSGFTYNSQQYQSSQSSQIKILAAANLALQATINSQAFNITWVLADDSTVALDRDAVLGMAAAMGSHIYSQQIKAQQKRALIDAATSIEEVNAISWST